MDANIAFSHCVEIPMTIGITIMVILMIRT